MSELERAEIWADLLTFYRENWRANVPVDATVDQDAERVQLGDLVIERGSDGLWFVTTDDERTRT